MLPTDKSSIMHHQLRRHHHYASPNMMLESCCYKPLHSYTSSSTACTLAVPHIAQACTCTQEALRACKHSLYAWIT